MTAALWKRIHFDHHQDPHRLDVLFGSLATTLPTIAVTTLPLGWVIAGPAGAAAAFTTGMVLISLYEFCHSVQHLNHRPCNRYLRRIKKLHLAHHFHDQSGNFGITASFVDRVFGTFYDRIEDRPRNPHAFNLGYDRDQARRYPWVAALSGRPPRDRPDLAPRTGAVEIVPVGGSAELERFIRVPFDVHRHDPFWVPPLLKERRDTLRPETNPFFEHADVRLWIARRNGRDVGRISAQIDALALEACGDGVGHFGMIAAIDDARVFSALTGAAEEWLKIRGMTVVRGPFNLSINQEAGLLVEGFDRPPMLLMPHDRPYVGRHLEELGYAKAKDLLAYLLQRNHVRQPGRLNGGRLLKGITLRPLRMDRFADEVRTMIDIFNDAWSGNWGFVPMTEPEVDHMAKQMRPLIRERLVWFAEVDGQPAAFIVCLPNVNEALADLRGRLLPFGWARLLWRLKVSGVASARVPLMGVRKAHQGTVRGHLLPFVMMDALKREALAQGFLQMEMSWILEDNTSMRRIIESVGGRVYKTYRIFEKRLS